MAECEKMMRLCEESIDRTLTPEEQEQLERHLSVCQDCAAYLADLQFMTATLAEEPAFPGNLHASIMSGILEEASRAVIQTHRPNRVLPALAFVAAAAACVVLALSGVMGDLLYNLDLTSGGDTTAAGSSSGAVSFDAGEAAPADAGTLEKFADVEPYAENGVAQSAGTGMGRSIAGADGASGDAPAAVDFAADMGSSTTAVEAGGEYAVLQPQVGAFISNVMEGEVFAACYLVEGGEALPEIGQVQQRDEHFSYYVADNSPAQLETLLGTLENAGCTVQTYEEVGVLFNEEAHRVIIVLRLD